jgi:hypothetical protein
MPDNTSNGLTDNARQAIGSAVQWRRTAQMDAVRIIKSGFNLDKQFAGKPEEVNSTLNELLIAIRGLQAQEVTT